MPQIPNKLWKRVGWGGGCYQTPQGVAVKSFWHKKTYPQRKSIGVTRWRPNGVHKWSLLYRDQVTKCRLLKPVIYMQAAPAGFHLLSMFPAIRIQATLSIKRQRPMQKSDNAARERNEQVMGNRDTETPDCTPSQTSQRATARTELREDCPLRTEKPNFCSAGELPVKSWDRTAR